MLPLRLEREYMAFRAKVSHDVGRIGSERFLSSHIIRLDAEDDPDLLELAALLGISSRELLNKNKLRAKLRRFVKRLSDEKRMQLSTLLGRWVPEPNPELAEAWVREQTKAVAEQVDGWLMRAAVAVGSLAVTGNFAYAAMNQTLTPEDARSAVAIATAAQATRARAAASNAVLLLNQQMLGSVATRAGVNEYRWITEDDDVVRDNHAALHYTIQNWNDPPMGGGTKADESGHPGSGFGCRCMAEPVILPT